MFQDLCVCVVQLCIHYLNSLEKYEKYAWPATLCYIQYTIGEQD